MVRMILSVAEPDKRWLEHFSRQHGQSTAQTIRVAVRRYREQVEKGRYKQTLKATAGKWKTLAGDSQDYVDRLRSEWETPR